MGNQLSGTNKKHFDFLLHELPGNIVFDRVIGNGRFLKTLKCFNDAGSLVMKVYFLDKPNEDVSKYREMLERMFGYGVFN